MRSAQLPLASYNTDKIANHYLDRYDPILRHLVDQKVNVLEIGVKDGGSLMLWRDYFPKGNIVGVDVKLPTGLSNEDRIRMFKGSQGDKAFLSEVAAKTAPDGFDVIIDDASHLGSLTKIAFWHLFENHLKPSGLYVIEDWGTGYWNDWPDGKAYRPGLLSRIQWPKVLQKLKLAPKTSFPSNHYGMVGFVKELIDEQGAADRTMKRLHGTPTRNSKFEKLVVMPAIVFVTKQAA